MPTNKIHYTKAGTPFIRVKPGKVQLGDTVKGLIVHEGRAVYAVAKVIDTDIREGYLYGLRNVAIDQIRYKYIRK